MIVARWVGCVAIWVAVVLLVQPVARRIQGRPRVRAFLGAILIGLAVLPPWILADRSRPLPSFLVGVYGILIALKTYDYLVRPPAIGTPEAGWWRCVVLLAFWPALDVREVLVPIHGRRVRSSLARGTAALASIAGGLGALFMARSLRTLPGALIIAKAGELVAFLLLVGAGNHALVAAFALAGYRINDLFRYPLASRSVLDFWRRYNVAIHRWLKRHVFERIGRRRPRLAITATFAASGLLHGWLFLPFAADQAGRQLAFFTAQAAGGLGGVWLGSRLPGALASGPALRLLATLATWAWFLAVAPLFLSGVARCLPWLAGPATP